MQVGQVIRGKSFKEVHGPVSEDNIRRSSKSGMLTTDFDAQEIVRRWLTGESEVQLAATYKVSRTIIRKLLSSDPRVPKDKRFRNHGKEQLPEKIVSEVVRMAGTGIYSKTRIAAKLGISRSSVYNALKLS